MRAYRLRAGYKLPLLIFTEDEALALTLSLLVARESGVVTSAPAFEGVRTRIRASAPAGEAYTGLTAVALVPVSPSRFQVLEVDADTPIRAFAESNGLLFRPGRGFYQFTKAETI